MTSQRTWCSTLTRSDWVEGSASPMPNMLMSRRMPRERSTLRHQRSQHTRHLCVLASAGIVPGSGLMISRQDIIGDERLPVEFRASWDILSRLSWSAKVTPASSSMTKDILREWLPGVLKNYRERAGLADDVPLIVMCDGHASRYDVDLWRLLKGMGVFLLLLPAHLSHVFQVIGTALARKIKARGSGRTMDLEAFPRQHPVRSVAAVLRNVTDTCCNPDNQHHGFLDAGLFPLNLSCIDGRQFLDMINSRLAKEIRDAPGGAGDLETTCGVIRHLYKQNPFPPTADRLKMRSLGGLCLTHSTDVERLVRTSVENVRAAYAATTSNGKKRLTGLWLLGKDAPADAAAPADEDEDSNDEAADSAVMLGEEVIPLASTRLRPRKRPDPEPSHPAPERKRPRKGGIGQTCWSYIVYILFSCTSACLSCTGGNK